MSTDAALRGRAQGEEEPKTEREDAAHAMGRSDAMQSGQFCCPAKARRS